MNSGGCSVERRFVLKDKIKSIPLTILRFAPLALCAVFMCLYLFSGKEITPENLLNFAPEDPLLAALFLILLYAFKSLTVVFPIIILNVLGGFIFEPFHALIVNSVGLLVELTVPYLIAKYSGSNISERMMKKHPKLAEIVDVQGENSFFMTFFLRVISCLPGDAVSMYLGTTGIPLEKYLLASYLGSLPGMVAATLLGMSITDPTSPMFWVAIGLTVGIAVISFLVYFIWRKTKKKKGCGQ